MYFSRKKRRMALRIALSTTAILSILIVLLDQRWITHPLCAPPLSLLLPTFCKSTQRDGWNLFYHLGGNGPWIPFNPGKEHEPSKLPINCEVDQMHMLSRHAERYPTTSAGTRHLALLERLHSPAVELSGPLAFLHDWRYFVDTTSPAFEELTRAGPYAGTEQSRRAGKVLRQRYDRLVESNKTTQFWTCSSSRDVETAKWFGKGFFGEDWETDGVARLHVVPEDTERGGDTLTPGHTCLQYRNDSQTGHDQGYAKVAEWQSVFTEPIAERLSNDAGGLAFTPSEVYSMMEMCGFEIIARGSSPWCSIFSKDEWREFEYARDLLHFYRAGPGNRYAGAMGSLWLNATTTLLNSDSARGVYVSFVHDGDIVPALATLGIFDEHGSDQYLPSKRLKQSRKWKTSNVVPMGGRLIVERVTCDQTGIAQNLRRSYVRLYVNDGLMDLESSLLGGGLPGGVGMAYWNAFVQRKSTAFGSFREVCGIAADAPDHISFLTPQYQ